MEEEIYFKTTDNLNLCGILSYPEQKTDKCIIFCHGITVDKDEDGIFSGLAKKLAEREYAVFRFDFRGHGESEGKSEEMTIRGETQDLESAVKFVQSKGFKEIGLVAASFGAGAASLYLTKNPNIIKAICLWNPLIDYTSWIKPQTRWTKKYFREPAFERARIFGTTSIGSRGFKAGRNLLQEIHKLKPYQELLKIEAPILFVHGDKDTYVPYQYSVKYSKIVKNGQLVTIKGAEHGFHDRPEDGQAADQATINFFLKYL